MKYNNPIWIILVIVILAILVEYNINLIDNINTLIEAENSNWLIER